MTVVVNGCGQEVVKRGRSRETVAGIMFVLVMALAIAGAREGLGLRLGLACRAYLHLLGVVDVVHGSMGRGDR